MVKIVLSFELINMSWLVSWIHNFIDIVSGMLFTRQSKYPFEWVHLITITKNRCPLNLVNLLWDNKLNGITISSQLNKASELLRTWNFYILSNSYVLSHKKEDVEQDVEVNLGQKLNMNER